jgi:hypothetical protein
MTGMRFAYKKRQQLAAAGVFDIARTQFEAKQ